MIHGGVYYTPGSLKARLCVEGARLMYRYCEDNGIPYERSGKLIVALDADELPRLDDLEARGSPMPFPAAQDRPRGDRRDRAQCGGAAGAPCAQHRDCGLLGGRPVLAAELRRRGVDLRFGVQVTSVEPGQPGVVNTSLGPLKTRSAIVCAGLWADRLARRSGAPRDPQIVPFRGAYLGVKTTRATRLNGMIYPVPDPQLPFLGVHHQTHQRSTSLGHTAMMVGARDGYSLRRFSGRDAIESLTWPGTWRVGRRYWRVGIEEIRMAASRKAFVAAAARHLPGLSVADLDGSSHAGVRAQAVGRDGALVDDFVISRDDSPGPDSPGAVTHLRNAPPSRDLGVRAGHRNDRPGLQVGVSGRGRDE